MSGQTYFVVNDTRYDNHHGCLMVMRNLHDGMRRRGWNCTGTLPVSSSVTALGSHAREIHAAELIIVNGEGSLHHDSRNARRILEICRILSKSHPIVLINTVWQDNDIHTWQPILKKFKSIYTRDRRSQKQLAALVDHVGYAPDLTFYDYPVFYQKPGRHHFVCTDSVVSSWTRQVLKITEEDAELDFCTLFTGRMTYRRGVKDWARIFKYRIYPWVYRSLHWQVPPRYRSINYAQYETSEFLRNLSSYTGACVARYHALCFAVQQQLPFVAVASNSYKIEALLEDIGLPADKFLMQKDEIDDLKVRLKAAAESYHCYADKVVAFSSSAKILIDDMFDKITD